jgi:type IV pilus assembly protein PilA
MLASIKQRLDHEDEGFTLIELMVVVLIIAILLAIAIPTFLGARNSANARSTQSNLRNALTAEQTNWTNTQAFDATTTDMSAIESALNWTTTSPSTQGGNTVAVFIGTYTGGTTNAVLELQGYAKDGNCYSILQSNDPTGNLTAYSTKSGACATPTLPTAAPTVNSGSAAAAHNTAGAWYQSW